MKRGAWRSIRGAAMTLLVRAGGAATAAERRVLIIVLHLTDFAKTDVGHFDRAWVEARRIFDDLGIRIVWKSISEGRPEAGACDGVPLLVSLLSPILVGEVTSRGGGESALGSAQPNAEYAFIFSERGLSPLETASTRARCWAV